MKLIDFDYNFPKNLIAQKPIRPRDHSRLLVFRRRTTLQRGGQANSAHPNENKKVKIKHKYFYSLPDYLERGDVLVLNNSKVFPARLIGKRKETGGKIEIFLLAPSRPGATGAPSPTHSSRGRDDNAIWQCLVGRSRKREGLEIEFKRGLECKLIKDNNDGTWDTRFNKAGKEMMEIVEKIGQVPLPPYIKRKENLVPFKDKAGYQTVYADNKKAGSVAAPTAGFHFTPRLIKKLKAKGVQFEYITLHVGLGTFAPVKVDDIKKHKMHAEWVEVKKSVIENIAKAKEEKRRIIAVGTTSVRTLEALAFKIPRNKKQETNPAISLRSSGAGKFKIQNSKLQDWVDIFIYPGFKFKVVDAMITNFHLPKSTLLMLVSAFSGKDNINKAYKEAIKKKYRFYSYGDSMFIY